MRPIPCDVKRDIKSENLTILDIEEEMYVQVTQNSSMTKVDNIKVGVKRGDRIDNVHLCNRLGRYKYIGVIPITHLPRNR